MCSGPSTVIDPEKSPKEMSEKLQRDLLAEFLAEGETEAAEKAIKRAEGASAESSLGRATKILTALFTKKEVQFKVALRKKDFRASRMNQFLYELRPQFQVLYETGDMSYKFEYTEVDGRSTLIKIKLISVETRHLTKLPEFEIMDSEVEEIEISLPQPPTE